MRIFVGIAVFLNLLITFAEFDDVVLSVAVRGRDRVTKCASSRIRVAVDEDGCGDGAVFERI